MVGSDFVNNKRAEDIIFSALFFGQNYVCEYYIRKMW